MPKYALRTATALALLALIAVIAISPLTTGASNATAFNAAESAPPAPPVPAAAPAAPAPPAIPAQYAEQCSNGTAVPNPASNAGLVADCAALLASKTTLAGASGNLNWSANRAISGWDGITIANSRVSKLELESYGLDGAIPAQLGNLAKIETLNLWNNDLTGEMPSELGNLANLKDLDLVSNNLSGAIPAELGNLANLKTLHLWDNDLTGDIPAEFGNLANLRQLNLSANSLTGDIPSELGNLANLSRLNLGSNSLSGEIPAELGNLANLWELVLSANSLSGDIPSELGNLANLDTLSLSSNPLSGEIPAEFGNLVNLRYLYLYRNNLTGEIPSELGNLAKLRTLNIQGNQLTGCIPRSLMGIALMSDGLPFCAAAITPTSTPTPTPTATPTSAPGATATPTIAAQCSNGAAVPNPDRNTGLVSDCVALLAAKPTLEGARGSLNWAANRAVSDWEGISTANNRVSKVELHGANLYGKIPTQLGNLSNLTHLEIAGTYEVSGEIPPELGNLANLRFLILAENGLTGAIPPELGNLANLRQLTLAENALSGVVPSDLGNLANLTYLNLSYNNLTGCVPQSLRAAASDYTQREQDTGFALPFCIAPTPTPTSAPRPPRPTITPTPTSTPRETPVATPVQGETPVATPTPTATPVADETPIPTPTPTATPAIVIETTPSPTATPTSVAVATDDPCIESLAGNGSAGGSWAAGCLSANPPNDSDYYARFYTFTLDAASEVTITLSSTAAAPYLYLLNGEGTDGAINRETGSANAATATITETLQPGSYTIESTTYYAETDGDFTLEFAATPAPAATCAEQIAGNASVNGNWSSACLSANPPNARDYYARFYTFTLDAASEVTITLSSNDSAPYLYLLNGAGTGGAIERETGGANASATTITETLQPGAYTIEATTYYSEIAGDFTLELEIAQ